MYYIYEYLNAGVISRVKPENLESFIHNLPNGIEGFNKLFDRDFKEIFDAVAVSAFYPNSPISDEAIQKIKELLAE